MTSSETKTPFHATDAASAESGRTLRLIAKRLAVWVRWSLVLAACALGSVAVYHSVCLWNLPDIGEPFDTKGLTEHQVANDQNSFIIYQKAVENLRQVGSAMSIALTEDFQAIRRKDWANPSEALRAWIRDNEGALELWRSAAERPLAEPPAELVRQGVYMVNGRDLVERFHEFTLMALIEAARLRREGDLAKAWTYCRAILRTGRHQQRRGSPFARMRGLSTLTFFHDAAKAWVADPRVTDEELRQALADLYDADSLLVPNSEAVKVEYLQQRHRLEDPNYLMNLRLYPDTTIVDGQNDQFWYRYLPYWHEVTLYFWNEPERSRRVLKLETANWLLAAAPSDLTRSDLKKLYPQIFTSLPLAELNAGVLPPFIEGWRGESLLFNAGRRSDPYNGRWTENDQSKVNRIKVQIAEKLFERRHHRPAESAKELVGPFLKEWPAEVLPP